MLQVESYTDGLLTSTENSRLVIKSLQKCFGVGPTPTARDALSKGHGRLLDVLPIAEQCPRVLIDAQ